MPDYPAPSAPQPEPTPTSRQTPADADLPVNRESPLLITRREMIGLALSTVVLGRLPFAEAADTPTRNKETRIWICGDNTGGFKDSHMKAIRKLYDQLEPAQYIVHVGDVSDSNTKPENMARELKYLSDFVAPFHAYKEHTPLYPTPAENRFFPCIGNHDAMEKPDSGIAPGDTFKKWLGLKRAYYTQSLPHLDLFFLDSVNAEPAPEGEQPWRIAKTGGWRTEKLLNETTQGKWWQKELKKSTAPWKITVLHTPPYDSIKGHYKGGHADVRFPYDTLGVDLVLSGHEHAYERLYDGKTNYIVQGVGGARLRPFVEPVPQSVYRYSGAGICMMRITPQTLTVDWYIDPGHGKPELADTLTINRAKS